MSVTKEEFSYLGAKRRRLSRGSIAMLFLPIMAVILMMVGVVLTVGQAGLQKVMTGNAVDAGCLAGASWIASGINECSWIYRKAETARIMLHIIYAIPFCPDYQPRHSQDAEWLWNAMMAPALEGGMFDYYTKVCMGVIEEGWRVGAQAAYTGCANNMIMRGFPTADLNAPQPGLYAGPASTSESLAWQAGDTGHQATCETNYPAQLVTTPQDVPGPWEYLVWRDVPVYWLVPGTTEPWFPCVPFIGSTNAIAGIDAGTVLVDGTAMDNPLAVTGYLKHYEYADENLPTLYDLDMADCSGSVAAPYGVCGLVTQPLPGGLATEDPAQKWPPQLSGLTVSDVGVTSDHQPQATGGSSNSLVWSPKAIQIESSCAANYTGNPTLNEHWGDGGIPPWINEMDVNLTSAN